MNRMNNIVKVVCKVLEILFWVTDATFAACLVIFAFATNDLLGFIAPAFDTSTLSIMGFEINVVSGDGNVINGAIVTAFLVGIAISALVAMIFRNVYLIYQTSEGKTKYSIGATPFQPENVRMIREIGIFAIAIPAVELVASIIATIVLGHEYVEVGVSLTSAVFGFIVLSLSQFFSYGSKLQEEVDGLL